jgi:hypothetical protein
LRNVRFRVNEKSFLEDVKGTFSRRFRRFFRRFTLIFRSSTKNLRKNLRNLREKVFFHQKTFFSYS